MTGKLPFKWHDPPLDPDGRARMDIIREAAAATVKAEFDRRDLEAVEQLMTPLCDLVGLTATVGVPVRQPTAVEMLSKMRQLMLDQQPSREVPMVVVSADVPFDDRYLRVPGKFVDAFMPTQPFFRVAFPDLHDALSAATGPRDIVLCSPATAARIHSVTPLRLERILSRRSALYDVALSPFGVPPWPPFEQRPQEGPP